MVFPPSLVGTGDHLAGVGTTYSGCLHNQHLATVVQRVDSVIHWMNHYPADSVISFDSANLMCEIVINPVDSAIDLLNN